MNAIKMKRLELLALVLENKAKHVKEFNESVTDYKALVLKLNKENLALAQSGNLDRFKEIKGMPPYPVSYEASYTRAARMLELSVDDTIEVEEDVFNQLVLDEWTWKNHFLSNSTMYKAG